MLKYPTKTINAPAASPRARIRADRRRDPEIEICLGVTANTMWRSVTREGVEIFLPPQLFTIFLLVSRAKFGITPERLLNSIYADSIDGGPVTGRKAMHVQRVNLNRRLAPLGLHIRSAGSGYRDAVYEFEIGRPL